MKDKKRDIFIIILITILLISLLFYMRWNYYSNTKKSVSNINEQILSYTAYESLFEYIVKNINIEGLEVKASTLGGNITAIDKELSFGKRQFLTLSGEYNPSNIQPTEEQFTLEDKDKRKQITIGIFYTNRYIGNDFIAWPTNKGFSSLNKNLVEKSSCLILTYKNLIILVHQAAEDREDVELMNNIVKSLINLLKKF